MLESYWLQICPYYDSRVVIYKRKMFISLAIDVGKQRHRRLTLTSIQNNNNNRKPKKILNKHDGDDILNVPNDDVWMTK